MSDEETVVVIPDETVVYITVDGEQGPPGPPGPPGTGSGGGSGNIDGGNAIGNFGGVTESVDGGGA